jgi:phenylpropionate dioxygenase-like ring-hydroxylating dioxygenase large terminal subunit
VLQEHVRAGNTVALFRLSDGRLGAIENRCAHRQLKLSVGQVQGCTLTCRYHGWAYVVCGTRRSPARSI